MFGLEWFFVALLGAVCGSFLNVVIERVPKGLSIVYPGSHCMACQTPIRWFDLVPLFSYWALKGRCRTCQSPFSMRHVVVEMLCVLLGLLLLWRFGWSLQLLEMGLFFGLLVAIGWIDFETWLIPLPLVSFLIATGLLFGLFEHPGGLLGSSFLLDKMEFANRLAGSLVGFGLFAAVLVAFTGIYRRTGRIAVDESAMGFGDPLLLCGIGAYLGLFALPFVITLASAQGILAYLFLKNHFKQQEEKGIPTGALPFGPFLAIAGMEIAFFGFPWADSRLFWMLFWNP